MTFSNNFKKLALLLAAFLLPIEAASESLKVSFAASFSDNFPNLVGRVSRALSTTDIEMSVVFLPNKRSLTLLQRGTVSMEFFRTPSAMAKSKNLIKLEPSIVSLKFNLATSKHFPENCDKSAAHYQELSMVGVHGIELYEAYFSPKFKTYSSVEDLNTLAKFVVSQRADITFIPEVLQKKLPKELASELIFCHDNFITFDFYAYLHKDYLWAKDKIEKALAIEFRRIDKESS